MKKNLISVLILALMVVNIVLTSIMMFSVMGTAKKTSALVTNIATALSLELTPKGDEAEAPAKISIADTTSYDVDEVTVLLKNGEDGKDHYCVATVTLMMNTKHEDYETLGAGIAGTASVVRGIINDVISSYTFEEAKNNQDKLKEDILARLQSEFDSTFIYKVTFTSILIS